MIEINLRYDSWKLIKFFLILTKSTSGFDVPKLKLDVIKLIVFAIKAMIS